MIQFADRVLDSQNLSSTAGMEGIMANIIPLLPHIPRNVESFLNYRAGPSAAGITMVERIKKTLLRVRPLRGNVAEKKEVPAKLILILHGLSYPPQIVRREFGEGVIAILSPVMKACDDGRDNGGGQC